MDQLDVLRGSFQGKKRFYFSPFFCFDANLPIVLFSGLSMDSCFKSTIRNRSLCPVFLQRF